MDLIFAKAAFFFLAQVGNLAFQDNQPTLSTVALPTAIRCQLNASPARPFQQAGARGNHYTSP
jgi:hypothetical protein